MRYTYRPIRKKDESSHTDWRGCLLLIILGGIVLLLIHFTGF